MMLVQEVKDTQDEFRDLEEYLHKELSIGYPAKSVNHIILYNLRHPEKTGRHIFVARENGNILGVLSDFRKHPIHTHYFHLRAFNQDVVRALLETAMNISEDSSSAYVVPWEFSPVASGLIGKDAQRFDLYNLRKGEQRLSITQPTRLLDVADYRLLEEFFSSHPREYRLKDIKERGRDSFMCGSFRNEELISFVKTYNEESPITGLEDIYTKPEYRRQGFASSAMSFIIQHLFISGFEEIQLYVSQQDEAHRLFKRLRFKFCYSLGRIKT